MKYVKYFGTNGLGYGYEDYEAYEDDDITEGEINEISDDRALLFAEEYDYLAAQVAEEFDETADYEEYYEAVLSMCGWEYITEEEYKEYMGE